LLVSSLAFLRGTPERNDNKLTAPKEIAEKLKTIPDYYFIRYSNGEAEICKPIKI
jgi:hypothetical protein